MLAVMWPQITVLSYSWLFAGFYAMSTFHLLAKGRPAIYKPFEVAAFLGFFTWCGFLLCPYEHISARKAALIHRMSAVSSTLPHTSEKVQHMSLASRTWPK